MPYLVGDLIKEIKAGGPVPSFPKSFKGPPKLEKEQEVVALDEKKSKVAQEIQTAKLHKEPQEDWVKKKWARYYELNKMGEVKPNFNKVTFPQSEQHMKDTQEQSKHKVVALAAESQTVSAKTEPRPRKKPRVKSYITNKEYLKKH